MRVSLKYWRMSVVLTVVLVALCGTTTAFADTKPLVLSPEPPPYGLTYGEWSNAWWEWALSIPTPKNPLLAEGKVDCSLGQSGPVWFLAGTFGTGSATRNCTIPAGTALFFPTVNFFRVSTGLSCDPDTGKTEDELRKDLRDDMKTVTLHEAQLDGVTLQDYRAGSDNPTFSFTLPQNNILDSSACRVPKGPYHGAVSDGYYVMLAPLSAGSYILHIEGATTSFTTNVTYNLTVLP
jgi:hypothetical protein